MFLREGNDVSVKVVDGDVRVIRPEVSCDGQHHPPVKDLAYYMEEDAREQRTGE